MAKKHKNKTNNSMPKTPKTAGPVAGKKQPRSPGTPSGRKTPTAAKQPLDEGSPVSVNIGDYDMGHEWGPRSDRQRTHRAFCRLREVSGMTWRQLRNHNPHYDHPCKPDKICTAAKLRLEDMYSDDFDELWRLRIGGAGRIWGVRRGNTFSVIWWDPEHEVWPMSS